MVQINDNPNITLYTNHGCPWAHRAHIVLKELGLEYKEVIIDLAKPREQWYLDINPRGLVPTIDFNGEIIAESGIVATFLADAYPSHVFPAAGNPKDALTRARINFFVDTWFSKFGSHWFSILKADSEDEKNKLANELVEGVKKELDPLLKDAGPFFGGSSKLTLAEALTAPFILRIWALVKAGYIPQSVVDGFNALPNFSKWANAVIKHESVTYVFHEEGWAENMAKRVEQMKVKSK